MRFLLLALATVGMLGACSSTDRPSSSVAAPVLDKNAVNITESDTGKTIGIPVGGHFSVKLIGVPTAGYEWAAVNPPAFLVMLDSASGPTHTDQLQPGFAGGSHWEVFLFEAASAGQGELVLEQRRPWDTQSPPNATFRINVKVP